MEQETSKQHKYLHQCTFCHGKISTKKLSLKKSQAPQISVITLMISTGSKKLAKIFLDLCVFASLLSKI